jgi:biotin carboxyl carrier protein
MDLDRIERLIKLFGRSRARELHVESDGWHLSLQREPAPHGEIHVPSAPDAGTAIETGPPAASEGRVSITAPLVGIFRQGGVQLQAGDRVEAGEPVGSIESMKILSPVLASEGGEIEEVLVEDGQPVEYGHRLFLLQPLNGRESGEEDS